MGTKDEQPQRLRLRWDRTVIGGQTVPYDFNAFDDERYPNYSVARIHKIRGGHIGGGWSWSMTMFGKTNAPYAPAWGTVDTKDEAARECEAAYFRFLAALQPS